MFFVVVYIYNVVCSKIVVFVFESQVVVKFVQECVWVVSGEILVLVFGVIYVIVKCFIFLYSVIFEFMGDVDICGNCCGISVILIVDKCSLMIDLCSVYIG